MTDIIVGLSRSGVSSYNVDMESNAGLTEETWERLVKNMLRAELMRRGMSHAVLIERLAAMGITETEPNLRNKLSRGRFTTLFFVQCLVAIGVDMLQVPSLASIAAADGEHGAQRLARKPKG